MAKASHTRRIAGGAGATEGSVAHDYQIILEHDCTSVRVTQERQMPLRMERVAICQMVAR